MPTPLETQTARIRRAAKYAWGVAVLCWLAMFAGTHLPGLPAPGFSLGDKVLHLGAFAILTICLLVSWDLSTGPLQALHQLLVALCCAGYGIFDEITQIPVGRSCDFLDWVADLLGIATGVTLYNLVRPLLYRLLSRPARPGSVAAPH